MQKARKILTAPLCQCELVILVRFVDPDTKENGRFLVASRAGKAQGQYRSWFHVKNLDSGTLKSVDYNRVDWSKDEEEIYFNGSTSVLVAHAQPEELAKWKQYGICTGQPATTKRWVLTERLLRMSEWSKQGSLCEVMKKRHLTKELIR